MFEDFEDDKIEKIVNDMITTQLIFLLSVKILNDEEINQSIEIVKNLLDLLFKENNNILIKMNEAINNITASINQIKKEGLKPSIEALEKMKVKNDI